MSALRYLSIRTRRPAFAFLGDPAVPFRYNIFAIFNPISSLFSGESNAPEAPPRGFMYIHRFAAYFQFRLPEFRFRTGTVHDLYFLPESTDLHRTIMPY